jgi:hypothetical protein
MPVVDGGGGRPHHMAVAGGAEARPGAGLLRTPAIGRMRPAAACLKLDAIEATPHANGNVTLRYAPAA